SSMDKHVLLWLIHVVTMAGLQCGYPKPTPSSTTMTTVEPSPPSGSLSCYTCFNCPAIDESTPVIEDATFVTCVSIFPLEFSEVIRSGSDEDHPDGACIQHSQTLMCWCSTDLCNDGVLPQNYQLLL
ncbi:unnamed protein product, partial [Meganyctiphanes norvegica]